MKVSNLHEIAPRERIASLVFPGHGLAARPGGFAAEVETPEGATIVVSRLDGETEWIADGYYAPGSSFPAYWNGEGSRCTILKTVSSEVAAALDAAVAA